MTVYSTLKPENTILNNVYLYYSFWKNGQVNVVKVEKDSGNVTDLNLEFKIIANDGYKIDYDNSHFELDMRNIKLDNLKTLTEPTDNDLLKIDLSEFATAEKIGTFKSDLAVDSWDCNFKNVDITNFKTIEKTVSFKNDYGEFSSVKYYIVLIDPKETSCMLGVYTKVTNLPFSGIGLTRTYKNDYGETSPDTFFNVHKIDFNAKTTGVEPEKPLSKNIFTTYVVDPEKLTTLSGKQEIYNEIIINTLSYPLKFKDEDLTETKIKLAGEETSVTGKTFNKNNVKTEIFKFTVPTFNNVEQCTLNLPFNNSISLNYEDLQNKTITGYLNFESLTTSTTLIINNGEHNIYKGSFDLESDLPYKPTGQYANYSKAETRLANDSPLLIIKCSQIVKQDEVIKGIIKSEIKGILKSELELLNMLTEKGVLING